MRSRAELDAVIVNGSRKGKQFTYALLDERVPESEAAFTQRGPSRSSAAFEALADSTRRAVFERLAKGPVAVVESRAHFR